MKVKDLYWAARNSTFFINLESEGRPLLCEPRLSDDALPRIGVSATVDSTMIRFMECRGEGHIALTVTEAGRLASWLHDMADGRWRDHNGYVPEVVK